MGDTAPLGNLTINRANNLTATQQIRATNLTHTAGTGRIDLADVQTTGGNVTLTTQQDINTGNITTSGGAIRLTSQTDAITTGHLNSSAASGGEIFVNAYLRITAGAINSSGTMGNGGNVTLDPIGDVQVASINAQGGPSGRGGNVFIESTGGFFRATNLFETAFSPSGTASISTAGGIGGGSITIRHAGGDLGPPIQPFEVGNGAINGTAGAITNGQDTIGPGQSFPRSYSLGSITIATDDAVPPTPEPTPTTSPEPTPTASPEPTPTASPEPTPTTSPEPTPTASPEPIPETPTSIAKPELPPILMPQPEAGLEIGPAPELPTPQETPKPSITPPTPNPSNPVPITGVVSPLVTATPSVSLEVPPESIPNPSLTAPDLRSTPPVVPTPTVGLDVITGLQSRNLQNLPITSSVNLPNPALNLVPNTGVLAENPQRGETSSESNSSSNPSPVASDSASSNLSLDNWQRQSEEPLQDPGPISGEQILSLDSGLTIDSPTGSPGTEASSLATGSGTSTGLTGDGNAAGGTTGTSNSVLGYGVNLDGVFEGSDLSASIWNIEQLRNSEFETHLGVKADPVDQTISLAQMQEVLKAIAEVPGKRSAIIYVVIRPKQLELILVPPEGAPIHKSVTDAPKDKLLPLLQTFRSEITNPRKRGTKTYQPYAQKLYQWILKPLEADLQRLGIETLLFSLDPGLRSLPLGALLDGNQFLIEKYSFSVIPSFSLTHKHYASVTDASLLAMGASYFDDMIPLPAVPTELKTVTQEWGGLSFLNAGFTIKNLKSQREAMTYRMIHLATHAEFRPGQPSNSFIRFWNNETLALSQMPTLGWHNPPVDLLVLSACRTALGDREAELGFAGLAVQSGVKSALASLWYVDDLSTLGLMTEFYRQLRQVPTKSEALRQAQLAMIQGQIQLENGRLTIKDQVLPLPPELNPHTKKSLVHPYYWSGFTMVGSPW